MNTTTKLLLSANYRSVLMRMEGIDRDSEFAQLAYKCHRDPWERKRMASFIRTQRAAHGRQYNALVVENEAKRQAGRSTAEVVIARQFAARHGKRLGGLRRGRYV